MRRLTLRREALTELTGPQLASVAGGTHLTCGATDKCTHGLSFDACPTVPVNICFSQLIDPCLAPTVA